MVEIRLDGKAALVTGGSQGIGRAIAGRFSAAGADVMIAARGPAVLEQAGLELSAESGRPVLTRVCDVSKAEDIAELFREAKARLGRVDILVNNAGGSSRGAFEELTDDRWQADLDLKLFAAIRLARLVLPGMRERRWGRIINVVSIVGKAPGPGSAPTGVSRAAGIALTKVLAHEYAPYDITVNAICPGSIMSAQWERFHQRDAPELDFETYIRGQGEKVPIGRLGRAEELANLVCFLASDAASYITGTAINVDGGKSSVV